MKRFGLRTGDCGGDTADGAENLGGPASQEQITGKNLGPPEPWTSIPDWAEGEGRTVCICGYSKGLWDLNKDSKSFTTLKSVQT